MAKARGSENAAEEDDAMEEMMAEMAQGKGPGLDYVKKTKDGKTVTKVKVGVRRKKKNNPGSIGQQNEGGAY